MIAKPKYIRQNITIQNKINKKIEVCYYAALVFLHAEFALPGHKIIAVFLFVFCSMKHV